MEERQTNYTIGEGYILPSGGKIYNEKVNPHVELRSMTARDEMKRLSPSTTPLKVLADIIEGCMIEKPAVHVYDMCLGDYEFLLYKARVVSYGNDYKLAVRCDVCGEITETTADIDSLELKPFGDEELAQFNACREITLPRSKRVVTLKYMTPRLLEDIDRKAKEMKRKYKSAELDFDTFAKLSLIVDTIDGEKKYDYEVEDFIDKLPAADMLKILNTSDKLTAMVGLDNNFFVTCKNCGKEISTFFRVGPEFFRPAEI